MFGSQVDDFLPCIHILARFDAALVQPLEPGGRTRGHLDVIELRAVQGRFQLRLISADPHRPEDLSSIDGLQQHPILAVHVSAAPPVE